mgnify:CR=1 FL=1
MKKLIASSIIGLGLISSLSATDCIMVTDLNVEFKNDSIIYMNNAEKNEIIEFAKFIKKTGLYAVVEGHTNKFAPALYNFELSSKRAIKVRAELISLGVDPSHIKAMGFGESSPLYDNDTEIGAQKNRRVIAEVFNDSSELLSYISSEKKRIINIKVKEQ